MFDNQLLMNDFRGMDEWGLQAVVRGFTNDYSINTSTTMNNSQSCSLPLISTLQDDLLFSFPESLFETATVLDELEELYKPFYPSMHHPPSPQTIITTSSISVPKEVRVSQKLPLAGCTVATSATTALAAKPKKSKKNQSKRVVHQTVDDLSSDLWAWRKYGQKPIKGSPYPRSYYRCSSSKGCLARKQVERSGSDPGMLIITYTAEHSHTHPIRRSSLAGSTRNKSSAPKLIRRARATSEPITPTVVNDSCCSPTTVLSSTTTLMACTEDHEFLQHASKQENGEEDEEQYWIKDGEENKAANADMISNGDLFPSLDELDRLTSYMALDQWFSDQIPPL